MQCLSQLSKCFRRKLFFMCFPLHLYIQLRIMYSWSHLLSLYILHNFHTIRVNIWGNITCHLSTLYYLSLLCIERKTLPVVCFWYFLYHSYTQFIQNHLVNSYYVLGIWIAFKCNKCIRYECGEAIYRYN